MKQLKNSGIGKKNIIFLLVGLLVLSIGFIIMGTEDRTISPIMLVCAYIIIIPVALLLPNKNDKS